MNMKSAEEYIFYDNSEYRHLSTLFEKEYEHEVLEKQLQKYFPFTRVIPMYNIREYHDVIEKATFKITINNGNNVKMMKLVPGYCHDNVDILFRQDKIDRKAFGFVLEIYDENDIDFRWREHSWGIKNGNIIETTHIRGIYVQLNI